MKRLALGTASVLTFFAAIAPITALKANAQLFENTPPEGADPALTEPAIENDVETEPDTDPLLGDDAEEMDYGSNESYLDVEEIYGEPPYSGSERHSQEYDGEYDGEGLNPRFEIENRETFNN